MLMQMEIIEKEDDLSGNFNIIMQCKRCRFTAYAKWPVKDDEKYAPGFCPRCMEEKNKLMEVNL
jgi:hypothetical protein